MLKKPWRLKASSIWLKNGMPVSIRRLAAAIDIQIDVISVSLVFRSTFAVRPMIISRV